MGGNASEEFFAIGSRDTDPLHDSLKTVIKNHANSYPRSQQIAIGPSQVGHPCSRNLISGLIAKERAAPINPSFDVLPSYIGTATHAALENAFQLDNTRRIAARQPGRWLTERKVYVADGLSGTCDLYDLETETVIDFKLPGTSKMAEYRRNGPSIVYKVQVQLYGRGYINQGYPVKRVGIWFLPRSGMLSTAKLWLEDYSETLVQEQLQRLHDLILLSYDMDLENHPERLAAIPITPYSCSFCPYFSVNPQRTASNPFACAGGEEYQPKISNHSGAVAY